MTQNSLLVAKNLAQHYSVKRGLFAKGQLLRAVDGVSFTLAEGETLAVVGESGCGKSTLARMVALLETPTSGELSLNGMDAVAPPSESRGLLRRTVQMVFQNPYGSLNPRKTVGSILEEPLVIAGEADAEARRASALRMIEKVGLRADQYGRYPHMFSGGQRQRIAIARALMLNPKLVVADEPVSALDVSIQAQVLNLLMDLQQEFGLAYLFISHDLGVVRHIANRVMVMYLGRPIEMATKEQLFAAPAHPYTRALLAATPAVDPADRRNTPPLTGELPSPLNPPPGCRFHGRCPHVTDRCRGESPELRLVEGRMVACHHAEAIA